MAVISVTRLHLRSFVFVPGFAWYTLTSSRRLRTSDGFLCGRLAAEVPKALGFWTFTAWRDAAAMKSFRNGGAHLDAMKKLPRWCDESAVLHWDQDDDALPTAEEAHRRMLAGGKLTKVKHPSSLHANGRACRHDVLPREQELITPG